MSDCLVSALGEGVSLGFARHSDGSIVDEVGDVVEVSDWGVWASTLSGVDTVCSLQEEALIGMGANADDPHCKERT